MPRRKTNKEAVVEIAEKMMDDLGPGGALRSVISQTMAGEYSLVCARPGCRMPEIKAKTYEYAEERKKFHDEWCGTRPGPMCWGK